MFSVRLLCIQTLHKIHMGLLVVQSAPEEVEGGGVLKILRALSGGVTWLLC